MQNELKKLLSLSKRIPSDGNYRLESSPKEQIRDWVRAQAFPYPGAFTFYGG